MHWEDLKGLGGEGGWRGDMDGEHIETHGCFISFQCMTKSTTIKIIIIIKKRKAGAVG